MADFCCEDEIIYIIAEESTEEETIFIMMENGIVFWIAEHGLFGTLREIIRKVAQVSRSIILRTPLGECSG